MITFKNLNLNIKILQSLEDKGYIKPTPIQEKAIPEILQKKDILGIAQTGTGKTAAFSLPILDNLFKNNISVKSGSVRALILTPTRELASQIAENVEAYSKGLNLKYAVIYGGVSDRPQTTKLQAGVDILIATPGRLMDLMSQGYVRLMQLETLVLDEADRMLDMGFINDIKKITTHIPANCQTILFSATMPKSIIDLANSLLKNPVKIEITPESTTVDRIDQKINFVSNYDRPKLLKHILSQKEATMSLVFCRTKYEADEVVDMLERSRIPTAAIHGNKNQDARERALNNFRDGKIKVLVATDVAARGIDISDISHVINYEIPSDPESYVHRIGRTARAGKKGVAISFCDPKDISLLLEVEKAINFKIPVDDSHPFCNNKSQPINQIENQMKSNNKNYSNKNKSKNFKDNKIENKKRDNETKKEGGFFAFLKKLFTSNKSTSKNQVKSKELGARNRKNSSKSKNKPSAQNANKNQSFEKPIRQRPERSTEQKPRPSGVGRKISSGKKPTE